MRLYVSAAVVLATIPRVVAAPAPPIAGQVLEFFETAALLFEQAILAITDQVRITGCKGGSVSGIQGTNAQQRKTQPRPEDELRHVRSLEAELDIKIMSRC